MTFEQWFTLVSVLLTMGALAGTWAGWRRKELRREDVLAWGSEGIEVLQTLVLVCLDEEHEPPSPNTRLDDLRFRSSILVERGRLFFRNARRATVLPECQIDGVGDMEGDGVPRISTLHP